MSFFYCSDKNILRKVTKDTITKIFDEYEEKLLMNSGYFVFSKITGNKSVFESDYYFSYVQGYVRDANLSLNSQLTDHHGSFIKYLFENGGSVQNRFTGLFTFFGLDKNNGNIILSTDWLAYYPVYYTFYKNSWIISSSLIAISAFSDIIIDDIGLSQMTFLNKPYCLGRRTMLKDVERILWSEKLILKPDGGKKNSSETGLYRIMQLGIDEAACQLWNTIEEQFRHALKFEKKVYIGLSGGIDSRLTFAAIPNDKQCIALTYGNNNYYEAKIARRVAGLKNSLHKCYTVYETMFPDRDTFMKYLFRSDVFMHSVWLSILEHNTPCDDFIILGDMCEAVTGRKITSKFSRNEQIKNFRNTFIQGEGITFIKNDKGQQFQWEELKKNEIILKFSAFKDQCKNLSFDSLIEASLNDLEHELVFIREHDIPFVELLDECHKWMHHDDGYQGLLLRSKFYATHLMSSNNILQATSCIHPAYRLNYRLVDRMFKIIPALKPYSKIPLVHTPYVRMSAPNFLKLLIWGLRSKADNFLIKRILKNKNPRLRYRLMPSINWVQVYQDKNMLNKMYEWFSNDCTKQKDKAMSLAEKRQKLQSWPVINSDIICMGATELMVNIMRDFIYNKK